MAIQKPKEGDAGIVSFLKKKVHNKYSPIVGIVGHTGSGKSVTALSLAREIDPEFSVQESCFFNVPDLVNYLSEASKKVIIMDEAGFNLGAKEYRSAYNKGIAKIFQTQRFRYNCYLLVLPYLAFLAKDHRMMLDAVVHLKSRGSARWWMVRQRHWEMFDDPIKTWWMGNFQVKMPPKEVMDAYSAKERPQKDTIVDAVKRDVEKQARKDGYGGDLKLEL